MPIIPVSGYFTAAEGRATDASFAGMSDAEVTSARLEVEDEIENDLCRGYAFLPRTNTVTLSGTGFTTLCLPHLYVRSITAVRTWAYDPAEYVDLTAPELADITVSDSGVIRRATLGYWPAGYDNVRVTYTYGLDEPPPRVKRAALLLFRYRVLEAAGTPLEDISSESIGGYSVSYDGEAGPIDIQDVVNRMIGLGRMAVLA